MRIAIIDLGTNTFNLLIVEITGLNHQILFTSKYPVKLGEGGIDKNLIMPEPIERAVDALMKFQKFINEWNCSETRTYATSAFRSATNGLQVAKRIYDETKLIINIIDGEVEAELIYLGVKNALVIGDHPNLIIDIGGGSIEFIIATSNEICWKKSLNIGAARLLAKFKPSEPITRVEINSIEAFLVAELKSVFESAIQFKVAGIIGSSGSFDSLAEIISNELNQPIDLNKVSTFDFNLDDFARTYQKIIVSNRVERLQIKGLVEMRVDMIVVSSICINLILQNLPINSMRLSTFSLKEGAINAFINK